MHRPDRKRKQGRATLVFAACLILLFISACGGASRTTDLSKSERLASVKEETAALLMRNTENPTVSGVGGDWLIFGLAKSGVEVPESYYERYRDNVRAAVKSGRGVLSDTYYTEYERVILGLTAIGQDPRDVEGYDLTPYLDETEKVMAQGMNACCFALLAAKACGARIANEESYIQEILTELDSEALRADPSYADYLAFGIEALSAYADREDVNAFLSSAILELSELQQEDGSFGNCETTAECIVALVQAGIDPLSDERFRKDGANLGEGLMSYYLGEGKFCHRIDEEANAMAGEKALLALDALELFRNGKRLYD